MEIKDAMQRIENMTEEERNRIMIKALDEAHIEYCETPGKVIFNGFPPELPGYCKEEVKQNDK